MLRRSDGRQKMQRKGLMVIFKLADRMVRFSANGENWGMPIKSSEERKRNTLANSEVVTNETAQLTEIFTSARVASEILFGP